MLKSLFFSLHNCGAVGKIVGNKTCDVTVCFVVIRIQNDEFQTAVYSSLALFEIYKLHIVSVSEKIIAVKYKYNKTE